MKKKYYAGIMVVAVSMAITACGGGSSSSKNEKAELAAELENELNADDKAAIKEAQAELKGETEKETESETDSDDPWTNGMLEKFGCADMPRPNEEEYPIKKVEFKELTKTDQSNGNKVPNGFRLTIDFKKSNSMYEGYIEEFENYFVQKELYRIITSKKDKISELCYGDIARKYHNTLSCNNYYFTFFKKDDKWIRLRYSLGPYGSTEVRGIELVCDYELDKELNEMPIKEYIKEK